MNERERRTEQDPGPGRRHGTGDEELGQPDQTQQGRFDGQFGGQGSQGEREQSSEPGGRTHRSQRRR